MLGRIHAGAANGSSNVKYFTMDIPIELNDGMNNISILSVMVGLPVIILYNYFLSFKFSFRNWNFFGAFVKDSGSFLERRVTGLTTVAIQCNGNEFYNFTNFEWGYKVCSFILINLYTTINFKEKIIILNIFLPYLIVKRYLYWTWLCNIIAKN